MIFIKKIFSLKITLLLIWFSFFLSINLNPAEFLSYNLINQIRLILPLLLCIFLISINYKNLKINYKKIFPIFFYIIFFLYIFFTFLSSENYIVNIFWPIYMFLSFLFIYKFNNYEDKLVLTKLSVIIILSVSILFLISTFIEMYNKNYLHFYGIFREGISYAGNESPPKPSGLSRLCLIIFTFFSLNYFLNYKYKKYYLLFLIFFFAIFTILFQSRTTSFLYFFINLFFIIFYFRKYFYDKRLILFAFILPIIMNMAYTHAISGKYILKIDNNIINIFSKSLVRDQPIWDKTMSDKEKIFRFSSGRFGDWEKSIKYIKKNPYKGNGAQFDRILLSGQSVHNSIIYSILSGGIYAGIALIIIYLYSIKMLINFYFKKDYYRHNNYVLDFCATTLIIISLRSVLETSFAIFSIDFLLYLISFLTLEAASRRKIK